MGPIELCDAFEVGLWKSAKGWYSPDADVGGIGGVLFAHPEGDEGIVGGEAERSNGRIDELRDAALREIVESAGPDLSDPDIHFAVAIGEECDEVAVVRDGGGKSFAFGFGDRLEACT